MASLLLVSADPKLTDEVKAIGAKHNCRVRHVYSIAAAKDWLTMQSFDLLFVDVRYGESESLELLNLAWTHHPMLIGGVLDVEGKLSSKAVLMAQALGAQVFSAAKGMASLNKVLRYLPENYVLTGSARTAVLVVEDIDSPRDIICAYVEALGYPRVDGAGSVKEAFRLLRKDPEVYFCILSDILMPKVGGVEFVRQVRAELDPLISSLPIIMLTAVPSPDNLLSCLKAGASGFLAKPPRKILLKKELERAKRTILNRRSPRLCSEKDAHLLEENLRKMIS